MCALISGFFVPPICVSCEIRHLCAEVPLKLSTSQEVIWGFVSICKTVLLRLINKGLIMGAGFELYKNSTTAKYYGFKMALLNGVPCL